MAESIITNALNSEHMPEIHIVPVEATEVALSNEATVEASYGEEIITDVVKHKDTIIPYDNSNETKALRAAAKTMGIKRLKWIVKEINGVKVRTIDRRTFNGRGRNRRNTTVSKILQS